MTPDYPAREQRPANCASWAHTLNDNRHGLIASAVVTRADGYAKREAAKAIIGDARQAVFDEQTEITLGVDMGYDAQEIIQACLQIGVIWHVVLRLVRHRAGHPHPATMGK